MRPQAALDRLQNPSSDIFSGYLKAVWPDFVGCVFEVWLAPGGPGKPSKRWGPWPPTFLKAFPGTQPRVEAPRRAGPENWRFRGGHEIILYLVSGANFRCVLHHFSSLTRWNRSRGQVRPEHGRKRPKLKFYFLFLGLVATHFLVAPGQISSTPGQHRPKTVPKSAQTGQQPTQSGPKPVHNQPKPTKNLTQTKTYGGGYRP